MIHGPYTWYQIAYALGQAVQDGLTTDTASLFVKPGDIVWDAADCGAIYVTWANVFLTNQFPEPVRIPEGNCAPAEKGAEFLVQVVRCMPPPPGLPGTTITTSPGADLEGDAAMQLSRDVEEMLAAVSAWCCQQQTDGEITNYVIPTVTTVGPEGSAIGAELSVFVSVTNGM